MDSTVHPVDERLPSGKLAALGLQHVLVMYAGAVAVPLIVGRALKLSPEQVALLISADLFVCGLVTLIQSWGMTQWFGIRLPVMMGVTFAAVAPMVSMANANPGVDGARMIFGAIIGAGIFGAIGTAAAGQIGPNGEVIRYAAGPALVFSFILLGAACALAALCYAELAAMIPQAGSAYAYSYATLGELVAWIIGWDLMLEYAVGNVAVAISWGDYFNSLVRAVGIQLPAWLTTGYRTALLSSNPDIHGLLDSAPHLFGFPILLNIPAFAIVMLITWLLLRGARESATANTIMVVIKLIVLVLF